MSASFEQKRAEQRSERRQGEKRRAARGGCHLAFLEPSPKGIGGSHDESDTRNSGHPQGRQDWRLAHNLGSRPDFVAPAGIDGLRLSF